MAGGYFLVCSLLEKCGNFWKNGSFSGRIWPDWGNTTRADMAGLGSIGLKSSSVGIVITSKGKLSHRTVPCYLPRYFFLFQCEYSKEKQRTKKPTV